MRTSTFSPEPVENEHCCDIRVIPEAATQGSEIIAGVNVGTQEPGMDEQPAIVTPLELPAEGNSRKLPL